MLPSLPGPMHSGPGGGLPEGNTLTCTRSADRLTLSVDGADRAWVRVRPNLSIANAEPLRVGGKGPAQGNAQFAGEIDNVFLTIRSG